MDGTSREMRINAAFVTVADTLTTDYDMVDLLHTLVEECVYILDTQAGGLMLVDSDGRLQLMTSTSEGADLVDIMQLNAAEGPCVECFRTGIALSVPDIRLIDRWPAFRSAALEQGFLAAHATPMKLRGQIIGTMNLFGTSVGDLTARDAAVAQALADVATIGILQERMIREGHVLTEQLHHALDSRIVIEQAKGVIAYSLSKTMDEAFSILRHYARSHNVTIRSVAEGISNRTISVPSIQMN
jgi:GAF domain-containing protein